MPTAPRRRMNPAKVAPSRVAVEKGHGYVRSTVSDREGTYHESDYEVQLNDQVFSESDPPAYVKVSAGLTINMGNFESLRIDCSLTLPCKRGSIDKAHQTASDFVAGKISEEQTNWLGQGNQKSRGKAKG